MATELIAMVLCLIFASAASQMPNCINGSYVDKISAVLAVDNCTYPLDKFNPDCVADSCPQLTHRSLCPIIFSNGRINIRKVEKVLKIITKCLESESICGYSVNPIRLPGFTEQDIQAVKNSSVKGTCVVHPNTSYIFNVNTTIVNLLTRSEPLTISIKVPNLVYAGLTNCDFELRSGNSTRKLIVSDIEFQIYLNVSATSLLWLRSSQTVPNVQSSSAQFKRINLTAIDSVVNLAHVQEAILKSDQQNAPNLPVPEAYGKFIDAFVNNAFEVVKRKCH